MINYFSVASQNGSDSKNYGRLDNFMDTADDIEIDIEGNESASLIDKTAKKFNVKFESMASDAQKAVEAKTGDLRQPNYVWMSIFFAVGCLFLLAAFTSLPFILISPAAFNMYFSLASTCMLISVSFYYGPLNYIKSLFERKNIMVSTLFIGATLASLSTILFKTSYLWSIGLVII